MLLTSINSKSGPGMMMKMEIYISLWTIDPHIGQVFSISENDQEKILIGLQTNVWAYNFQRNNHSNVYTVVLHSKCTLIIWSWEILAIKYMVLSLLTQSRFFTVAEFLPKQVKEQKHFTCHKLNVYFVMLLSSHPSDCEINNSFLRY